MTATRSKKSFPGDIELAINCMSPEQLTATATREKIYLLKQAMGTKSITHPQSTHKLNQNVSILDRFKAKKVLES